MKFVHTADWHLGKIFHEVNLVEDQAHVLGQLESLLKDEKADLLIVAGDIYDRSVASTGAIKLLDDFLGRVVQGLGVQVALIAGNHDGPERLTLGSSLLGEHGLHIAGPLDETRTIPVEDRHGAVEITLLPFAQPEQVRNAGFNDEALTFDEALAAQLAAVTTGTVSPRSMVVSHAFVTNMDTSDSERTLTVGGADTVSAEHYSPYSYAALGHLHRPQEVSPNVRYSGSLLKYSFSEADHVKGVVVGEMDRVGCVTSHLQPLRPVHDVRRVTGLFDELIADSDKSAGSNDYIEFSLLDKTPVLDAMARLRQVYPNALSVRRPTVELAADAAGCTVDLRRVGHEDLFADFFEAMTGDELSAEEREALAGIVADGASIEEAA